MTAAVSLLPSAGTTRPSKPSLGLLSGIEIRKSLSTRSGKAVVIGAMLLGPAGVAIGSLGGEGAAPAAGILSFTGMLTGLVLLTLGVLSTAGEWTHKSVQVSYLLVPQRLRVLSAKGIALALQGAVFAAGGAVLTMGMMVLIPDPVWWDGIGRSFAVAVLAGAAFAVIGAGIGAALGNSPAALTGTYLTMLGVFPILQAFKPAISEKIDPVTSVVNLAQEGWSTTPVLVVVGWVVVSTAVGAYVTRRRSVQ
jgi:ABC-2 type transport system permease protein